jgi:hypothetical protein
MRLRTRSLIALNTVLTCVALMSLPACGMEILGSWYRADTRLSEFMHLWHEGISDRDPLLDGADYAYKGMPLGSSLHVLIRNDGEEPLHIDDILFEGISLKRAVAFGTDLEKKCERAASIAFSDLSAEEREQFVSLGEPVWWRVEPETIQPGGVGEGMVRLRGQPKAKHVRVGLQFADQTASATVRVKKDVPRIEGISFSPNLDQVFLYFRHPRGSPESPSRILVDGRDITEHALVLHDGSVNVVPVVLQLETPLKPASFHVFQGIYRDRSSAWGALRAWHFDFAYGIWGSRPGQEGQVDKARDYVNDIYAHNINVQMEMVGSAAVAGYLKSEEGLARFAELGLRRMVNDPGKGKVKEPFAYFLQDEPDAHDYEFKKLDLRKRLGAMGQWLVRRSARIREQDPVTPHLLNVDVTFKPENWPMYGQLPDILATDPYYAPRLRECYERHPERLPQFTKATWIYAVAAEAFSAAAPKPTHLILYSVRHTRDEIFRYPTPEEKRIEVYYSLAAGAKGISYWWYTPVPPAYGCGAPEGADLWNEIGILGAEVRTAGPVLSRSCPAELPVTPSPGLWVRTLLAAPDTVVLVCVNDKYLNDRAGTVYVPLENAEVQIQVPSWMETKDVFEITSDGTRDIRHQDRKDTCGLDLGRIDVTRLVIITSDQELRSRLEKRYQDLFAQRVTNLKR